MQREPHALEDPRDVGDREVAERREGGVEHEGGGAASGTGGRLVGPEHERAEGAGRAEAVEEREAATRARAREDPRACPRLAAAAAAAAAAATLRPAGPVGGAAAGAPPPARSAAAAAAAAARACSPYSAQLETACDTASLSRVANAVEMPREPDRNS